MTQVKIPLAEGLKFAERNADNSRFLDASFTAKPGVLSSRKSHLEAFDLSGIPRKLLYSIEDGVVYVLYNDGTLFKEETFVDNGYSTEGGYLIELVPNSETVDRQLFIAGGTKMRKYDGTNPPTKWGLDAPLGGVTATFAGIVATSTIDTCDDSTTWVAVGCVLANEATIKQQGTNSLKIALTAATAAQITRNNFAAVKNLTVETVIGFYIRMANPGAMQKFTMTFDFANNAFATNTAHRDFAIEFLPQFPASVPETTAATLPQTESGEGDSELTDRSLTRHTLLPATPDVWKHMLIGKDTFAIIGANPWATVYNVRFNFLSSATQDIYIDYIYASIRNQDDALGARYKYAYYNNNTGQHSNLNPDPSAAVIGQNGAVDITGFAQPTDPQVTHYQIYRDTGSDGNYRVVGLLSAAVYPPPAFQDGVSIRNLGDLDTNDNAPPPNATLAVEYRGSVWLNDTTNLRRLWRSVPGRYESFALTENAGFFDVSVVGDEIVDIGIVRGQLYLITKRSIIQVLAPDTTPKFVESVNMGTLVESSVYIFRDFMVFAHHTGLYVFDTANVKQLPHVESLFNPLSGDPRRITNATISTLVIGSDAKHIWLSTNDHMYTYAIDSKQWVEESVVLRVHEDTQVNFHHIAGSNTKVYHIYAGTGYDTLSVRSDAVELTNIGHLNSVEVEYYSLAGITVRVILDGIVIGSSSLPGATRRTWNFINFGEHEYNLGQQVELEFIASAGSLLEIYDCQVNYTPLLDTTHYHSEFFKLPDARTAVVEILTKVFGLETGTATARIYVDDKVSREIDIPVVINQVTTLRSVIKPLVGTVCMVDIVGPRLAPIDLSLNVVVLGNGERKNLVLNLGGTSKARLGDSAKSGSSNLKELLESLI